jgi:hypothetical protein
MTGRVTGNPVDLALRCYPRWWRDRYEDEIRAVVADLTEDGHSSSAVTLNLFRGALRARTRATGMPRVYDLWCTRARVAMAAATLPWVLMGPLVLIVLGGQSLHSPLGKIFPDQLAITGGAKILLLRGKGLPVTAPPMTPAGSVAWYANVSLELLFLVTLMVLFIGWAGLTGAIKRSPLAHRRRISMLAWIPGFSLLADIVLAVVTDVLMPHSYRSGGGRPPVPIGGHLALSHALGTILVVVTIVGWLASIVCVAVAVKRADISPFDLRFGRSVSVVVASLFTLTFVAYAVWGVGLLLQSGEALHGRFTTIAYSRQDLWPLMLVVLLLAVLLSTASASVARRSWRVIAYWDSAPTT